MILLSKIRLVAAIVASLCATLARAGTARDVPDEPKGVPLVIATPDLTAFTLRVGELAIVPAFFEVSRRERRCGCAEHGVPGDDAQAAAGLQLQVRFGED